MVLAVNLHVVLLGWHAGFQQEAAAVMMYRDVSHISQQEQAVWLQHHAATFETTAGEAVLAQ
jgi:hypothetical protein